MSFSDVLGNIAQASIAALLIVVVYAAIVAVLRKLHG